LNKPVLTASNKWNNLSPSFSRNRENCGIY